MKVHSVFSLVVTIPFFILSSKSFSQGEKKVVKLVRSDVSEYDKSIIDAQRVKGNVQFLYEGTQFFCDSAHIFSNKDFNAYGNIRIIKPGEFQVTAGWMKVDQKKKIATLSENVVLKDNQMTLTSPSLFYAIDTEIASYNSGGRITSNANKNVLTSKEGTYFTKTETFYFKKNVVLKNPDYTVLSDTLQYQDRTEKAFFFGPSKLNGKDSEIYCENGWYDTKKEICQFNKHAWVRSEKTILKGDSIYYDGEKGFGEVFRNAVIRDTTSNFFISGEYGYHIEKNEMSLITQKALLTQIFEDGDSLFIHADTLKSFPDSSEKEVLYAYRNVRFFKSDMQGVCDSMKYAVTDSTLKLFANPVMWSEENQITGDTIIVTTSKNKIDRMFVRSNGFILSQSDSTHYNQIKGRNLDAQFFDNELRTVFVEGNGQLIYFPEEEDTDSTASKILGMNKGECSNIHLYIEDNTIKRIRLEREANSKFQPMKLTDPNTFKLDGFKWDQKKRPLKKEDVFLKPE